MNGLTRLLWRIGIGFFLIRGTKLVLRWAPTVGVAAAAAVLWPSVVVAWGLRGRALPWAARKWPRREGHLRLALWVAGALAAAAVVAAPPTVRSSAAVLYWAGYVAPVAAASGALPADLAAGAVVTGALLWLLGGALLAGLWPLYAPILARAWRVSRFPVGKPDGRTPGGNRDSGIGPKAGDPVDVALRPVATQDLARRTFGEDRWTVEALYGPGLLSMIVAPPGVGKTEVVYGSLAAALDGVAFCGLTTSRPRRVLLLTEMEPKTIQPALLRWGFVRDGATGLRGLPRALRDRVFRPADSPGHLIAVVCASDAYAPDDLGRRPTWPDVVRATLPVLARGGYDLLVVDSLARWMGNDSSNAVMLDALGVLRQVTRLGIGVVCPHHCAKDATPPYAPRGGSAILGELDVCWSLAHPDGAVTVERLKDPRRVLACVKSRFQESVPPPLTLKRVEDAGLARPRYGYELCGARAESPTSSSVTTQYPPDGPNLTENQLAVLAVLAGSTTTTAGDVADATGIDRERVREAFLSLIKLGLANVAGQGATPARGGRAPVLYKATDLGRAAIPKVPQEAAS